MNSLYDEFRIAVHSVWNRRWLALGVAWGICLLGWLVIAMIPLIGVLLALVTARITIALALRDML